MKKATAAPAPPLPPPPASSSLTLPRPASGSSSMTGDSDSASVESGLEGRMLLSIVLPDGSTVPMEVERRTAMMDLLVLVTKANNLNPGSYALDVKSTEAVAYKPNTPIGTVGVSAVHVVPRARDPNSIHRDSRSGTKPFEKTFRLRVHLPRNQLHVLRVSSRTPLAEVFEAICTDRGLTATRYELRHPIHEEIRLDHARCLADYDLSEVALVAVKDSSSDGSLKRPDPIEATPVVVVREQTKKKHGILSFMFKRNKSVDANRRSEPFMTSSVYHDANHSESGPLPTVAAPSSPSSASDMSASSNKSLKKRPAPPPPPPTTSSSSSQPMTSTMAESNNSKSAVSTATGDVLPPFAASHSRHSSDSSGYHESSILGDSPEMTGVDLECVPVHLIKGSRKAASTTNIHLIDSTSSLSVSGGGGMRKRKAPPPPPPPPEALRSATLPPPTSKPSAASVDAIVNWQPTVQTNGTTTSGSSTVEKPIEVASAPVPKPRHVLPSRDDDAENVLISSDVPAECNGHEVVASSDERVEDGPPSPMLSPPNASRHSSSSSADTSDKADSVKSVEQEDEVVVVDVVAENDICRTTADDVHDKNLKNARKSSLVDTIDVLKDSSSSSPKVERDETVLTDAINEFHNEINSAKLNLTDLWSKVVTMPPVADDNDTDGDEARSKDVEIINNDDTDDKLSIGETDYFDMPNTENGKAEEEDDDEDEDDSSAKQLDDIHSDDPESSLLVNGVLNEHVASERRERTSNCDTTPSKIGDDDDSDVVTNGPTEVAKSHTDVCENDALEAGDASNKAVDNDLVVTWEYRIPEVPVEFQNDPREEQTIVAQVLPEGFDPETKSLTTVYMSKANDTVATTTVAKESGSTDVNKVIEQDQKVVQAEKDTHRNYGRRPVVQFSISTYRSRATEETSYREKLVRVDSSSTELSPSETEPPRAPTSDGQKDANATATRSMTRSRSELQLNEMTDNGGPPMQPPLKDERQLQEEYSKLHQQFLQWQKQLLNNQSMLQMQQVLPESTATDQLRPLQDFQDRYASLPPLHTMKHEQQPSQQPKVQLRKPSNHVTTSSGQQPQRLPRPISVDLYPWTRRKEIQGDISDGDDDGHGRKSFTIDSKSWAKDHRKTSFNEPNSIHRPIITINRQSSSAACFPRHPVVRGFATLPPSHYEQSASSSSSEKEDKDDSDSTKKCVKTVTYFGDPINQRPKKPEIQIEQQQQRSVSQIQLRNAVRTNQPDTRSSTPVAHVNGNSSKFSTVVSVGGGQAAKSRQLSSSTAPTPPPPPPPPQPQLTQTASFVKGARTKPMNTVPSRTANSMRDPKEELMSAIRDFGGRFGLKKVSAIETRWQSRHGNVT